MIFNCWIALSKIFIYALFAFLTYIKIFSLYILIKIWKFSTKGSLIYQKIEMKIWKSLPISVWIFLSLENTKSYIDHVFVCTWILYSTKTRNREINILYMLNKLSNLWIIFLLFIIYFHELNTCKLLLLIWKK